jgi:hypothetical protein
MALINAAKMIAGAVGLMLFVSEPSLAQQKPPSIYTVSNVKAEAEAVNSVEAKKLATATAETRAFRQLVSRIVDYRAQARIPEIPAAEVERLVSDIDVRGEGVSGTSYVAMFGVSFSERAVSALLSQYGVIPITDRGPEILIVPVYIEEGAARTTDRNPWRNALLQLDLTHALVPAKIAPARGDVTAAIANAYLANPTSGVETLKTQYRTTQLLFAVAELESGGETLTIKLIGTDALGAFAVERKVKAKEGVDEPLIQTAAQLAFETVQQRWKLTRDTFVDASGPAGSPASPGAYTGGGGVVPVQITAQFSGLKEWQSIRARLQSVPGIQNWDLRSVNPRSAEIGFDFPGGAERLTAIAAGQGLSVENGPAGLVVKTR